MSSTKSSAGGRVSTGLVALGSAAIFVVYSAGYLKTQAAAKQLEDPRAGRAGGRITPEALTSRPPEPPSAAPAGRSTATATPTASAVAVGPAVRLELPTTPANRPVASAEPAAVAKVVAPAASVPAAAVTPSSAAPVSTVTAAPTGSTASAAPVPAPAEPVAAVAPLAAAKYKDGTYSGWGGGRHGDIQAQVVVAGGRIASAEITQCLTRWSCSWVSPLPPQVLTRQSAEVDYVSGATQSTIAFYNAVVDALAKAK